MFDTGTIDYADKAAFWGELATQARGLMAGETDGVANAANLSLLPLPLLLLLLLLLFLTSCFDGGRLGSLGE